jgi:serine/threonine protein kinase
MASSASTFKEHVRFEEPPSLSNEPPRGELSNGSPPSHETLIEEDGDYFSDDEEQLPFKCREVLGNSYSAVVQEMQHTGTKEIFARKVIVFPRRGRLRVQAEDRYRNEVDMIRSLKSHRHVVQLFVTYTRKLEGCLLLQPAANEGDLRLYLDKYADAAEQPLPRHVNFEKMTKILEQSFGCLSSGLAYMHNKGIRHKDTKPGNILIHGDFVIYTDFSASKDTTKDGQCTTEGLPEFLTRKYAPSEVLEHDKRNFAADVYTLGYVFVEIFFALSSLADRDRMEEQTFFSCHGQCSCPTSVHRFSIKTVIPAGNHRLHDS